MSSFNRVIMAGNLTRDPEYKQLPSGQAVCRLGLASNRQFRNKQNGEMIQEVCYIDIDVWGAQAESCRQYLQKGRPVLVEGRLKLDMWDDQSGQKRSKHSIVADRVVFLSQSQQAEANAEPEQADAGLPGLNPNNPQEKELMNQIQSIKSRTQARVAATAQPVAPTQRPAPAAQPGQFEAAKAPLKRKVVQNAPPAATASGEVAFNDEPPFTDDLPF